MSKRKKSKKTSRRRKRGLGSMPSNAGKRALLLLTTIAASNVADEGMSILYGLDILKQKVETGKTAPKINMKKALASGSAFVATSAGAVLIKNDYVSAALTGVAVTASKYLKDDLVKPVLGMGAVSHFLNLYKKDVKGVKGVPSGDPPVQLGAPTRIQL